MVAYLATTFSPDGELIYYVAVLERNNFVPTLYRVPVLGGTPDKSSRPRLQCGWVLSRRCSIRFRTQKSGRHGADGCEYRRQRRAQDDCRRQTAERVFTSGPSWSPDGKRIACGMFDGTGAGYSTVVEVPVEGGDPRPIGSEKWASIGRVIWLADNSGLVMTAQPEFSSIGTQVWFLPYPGGQARRITNDLNGYGEVSLGLTADSGTIATIQQVNASSIWITDPNQDESRARQILKTNLPETVAWTPDGKIVYASRTGENWDIWMANRDGSESRQLTADAFIDQQPSVCADGRYIVFQSNRSRSRNIWRMNIDGSNQKQLTDGNHVDAAPVCSPDGRFVVFMSGRSGTPGIWKVGIDGGAPVQLTKASWRASDDFA